MNNRQGSKKEIITIAGKPGSGKSTTANAVAKMLNYQRFSSGDFMRDIAKKRDVTLERLGHIAETDRTIDEEVDERLRQIGIAEDKLVIDSRLAFHWIPSSFKVYLELDLAIAADRIFTEDNEARKASGEIAATKDEMYASLAQRLASEQKRYYSLYQIDPYNTIHFDLVVDTSHDRPEHVAILIISAYKKWLEN